jgi:hypothetical protein
VSQAWTADVSDYISEMSKLIASTREAADAVEDLQHTIDELHGKTVDLGVDTAAANAAAAVNDLAAAEWKANAAGQMQMETTRLLAESDALLADQDERLTAVYADRAHNAALLIGAEEALNGTNRDAAQSLILVADAGTRVAAAGNAAWRPWFLFGATWQTALHWIVAGGAELAAVAVPAAIALGAGLLVASQGAQNATNHMVALWTATEATGPAFHTTTGDVLGLGHALQTAQDAANPGVYEILGSVINDAKTRFADFANTGLQVVHMMDEFSARITVDLQGALGGQLKGLLADMVPDLQEIGQVFGNLGHSVLNFAAAMPGLARVLLGVADGISRVVLAVSSIPAGFITAGMAMEEFFRWGGLVLGVMARLAGAGELMASFGATGFITKFGAALLALVAQGGTFISWVGTLIGRLAGIAPAAEGAGTAMVALGGEIRAGALEMSAGAAAGWAALAAGAVIAIVAISRIKDATDQWVATTDKAVAASSDLRVLGEVGTVLAQNTTQLTAATQNYNTVAKETGTQSAEMTARFGAMNGEAQRAAQDVGDLTQQQQHLVGVATQVAENVGVLGQKFHTSAAGAIELANAAGVNLQDPLTKSALAMRIAEQQITNLITGLGAMGAPAGVVGRDFEALGVQSQLAGTKVQQLNQSWDQFVITLTSGMGAWASTRSAIQQMSAAAFTLQGHTAAAAAGWQTFTGAINSGESSISFLRTGMAEGAVSVGTFESTVKGLVGEMVPFAAGNKAAVATLSTLAQEAGGPATSNVKTLAEWAGVKGSAAAAQYAQGLEKATVAMSNMSAVARNLSATVSSQVTGALSAAILKTAGISAATNTYVNDLHKYGPAAQQTMTAQNALNTSLANAYRMSQQASTGFRNAGSSASAMSGQTNTASASARNASASLNSANIASRGAAAGFANAGHAGQAMGAQIAAGAHTGQAAVGALQAAINALHGKTVTITTLVNTITNESIIQHVTTQVGPHLQHGGVLPGFQPGVDSIHAMLSPGEGVLNPYAVRMLGSGWVHAVNRIAESGGSVNPAALRAGVSGPGGGGAAVIHNHIILDGREIATSVRRIGYEWQTRNSGVRSGLSIPGTRVG